MEHPQSHGPDAALPGFTALHRRYGPGWPGEHGIDPVDLVEQVNAVYDKPFHTAYYGDAASLARAIDAAVSGSGTDARSPVEQIAAHVASAAQEVGGIDLFGRHWCADHGHRATQVWRAEAEGRLPVAARYSVRPTIDRPDGLWTVTVHQPCCPRTKSMTVETTTLAYADFGDWAQYRADERMRGESGNEDDEGLGWICGCLEQRQQRPIDIVYLVGSRMVERYWRLFWDAGFEVRLTDTRSEDTCDTEQPMPGRWIDDDLDLWHLRAPEHADSAFLSVNGGEEVLVGRAESDETENLRRLIDMLRR